MAERTYFTQQPVQGRLTRHIQALVSQARHNLAWRQIPELVAVDHLQRSLSLSFAELVGRHGDAAFVPDPEVAFLVLRAPPALNSARVQPNQGAGLLQACAAVAGLSDQRQQGLTLLASGHFSSSSHRAWNFFQQAPARLRLRPAPSLFDAVHAAAHRV